MGANYIFSLTPTFTQGLVLGQLSILLLLALILKYLFLESSPVPLGHHTVYSATAFEREGASKPRPSVSTEDADLSNGFDHDEHTAWFNLLLQKVTSEELMASVALIFPLKVNM